VAGMKREEKEGTTGSKQEKRDQGKGGGNFGRN